MKLNSSLKFAGLGTLLLLAGCGGGSTSTSTSDSAFPSDLSLLSPTVSTSTSTSSSFLATTNASFSQSSSGGTSNEEPSDTGDRTTLSSKIKSILSDPTKLSKSFSASRFITASAGYSPCYGPSMYYTNHPDGTIPNNGQLPSGDLGIWTDTVSSTNRMACSAAQLNRNIYAASNRVNMGIFVLASLRAASLASGSPVSAGSTNDLTTNMNALSLPNVTFSSATLSLDSSGTTWTYVINASYTNPTTSRTYSIQLTLQHTHTSTSAYPYDGLLTYKITDVVDNGNCPVTGGDSVSRNVVHVGTLKYSRTDSTTMAIDHRSGQYCGDLSSLPSNLVNTDGQLNSNSKYDSTTGQGWADNFHRFAEQYNPADGNGNYVYAWQAGYLDNNARILGVNLGARQSDGSQTGDAYFGFGDDISTTDGSIQGFICNWAGPGNSHSPISQYVQHQTLAWSSTNDEWEVGSGGSNIRYAPTNSCLYTYAQLSGGASFWYDRDLTGNTSGSTSQADLIVDSADSTYPLGLEGPGSSATIKDMMTARGYTLPTNF